MSVSQKNLENNIVLKDQSNNLLILETKIHLVENAESEVNDKENNIEWKQAIPKKGKDKGKEKTKKKKHMEFKWGKIPTSKQKQTAGLENEITHSFPKHCMYFNVFSAVTNLNASLKIIAE